MRSQFFSFIIYFALFLSFSAWSAEEKRQEKKLVDLAQQQAWIQIHKSPVVTRTPEELRDFLFHISPSPVGKELLQGSTETLLNEYLLDSTLGLNADEIADWITQKLQKQFNISRVPAGNVKSIYLQWASLYRLAQMGVTEPHLNSTFVLSKSIEDLFRKVKKDFSFVNAYDWNVTLAGEILSDLETQFPTVRSEHKANLNYAHAGLVSAINSIFARQFSSETLKIVDSKVMTRAELMRVHNAVRKRRTSEPMSQFSTETLRTPDPDFLVNGRATLEQLLAAIRKGQLWGRVGLEEFLHSVVAQDKDRDYYAKLIDSIPELKAMADAGARFRGGYVFDVKNNPALVQVHPANVGFFLDPVMEVLKRVSNFEQQFDSKILQEIPFSEAEKLAWNDTVMRFGINEVSDVARLQQLSYDDIHYEDALEFYEQTVIKYSLAESPKVSPTEVINVIDFKKSLILELQALRVQNFQLQAKLFNDIDPKHLFTFQLSNEALNVSWADLAMAKISVQVASQEAVSGKLLRSNSENIERQIRMRFFNGPLRIGSIDNHILEAYYILTKPLPHSTTVVTLEWPSRILRVSEDTFRKLFFQPRRVLEEWSSSELPSRLKLEAVNRDTELSHLIELLGAERDPSYSALRWRLFKYVSHRDSYKPVNRNLTEWLRMPEVATSSHRLNDLRWGGFAIHPMYWRVKDIFARASEQPSAFQEQTESRSSRFSRIAKSLRARIVMHSALSNSKSRVKTFGNILAGIGVAGFTAMHLAGFNPIAGNAVAPESLTLDSENQSKVHSFDTLQALRQQELFNIKKVSTKAKIPQYFNYLSLFNLPKDWKAQQQQADSWTSSNDGVPNLIVLNPHYQNDKGFVDLSISSYTKFQLAEFGLAIVTPSQHRLVRLSIRTNESEEWKEINHSYLVTNLGLYYARLPHSPEYKAGLFYKADFVKDARIRPAKVNSIYLNEFSLRNTTLELKNLGALELADGIQKHLSVPMRLSELTQIFANTGYYTYAKPSIFYIPSNGAFGEFKKFLLNGHFFYQCTGANNQLVSALNYYFKNSKSPFQALPVGGFVAEEGSSALKNTGHLHTLVTSTVDPMTFAEYDATPIRMDPEFQDQAGAHPFQKKVIKEEKSKAPKRNAPEKPLDPSHMGRRSLRLVQETRESEIEETKLSSTGRQQVEVFNLMRDKLHEALSPFLIQASHYQMNEQAHTWGGLEFFRYLQSFNDFFKGNSSLSALTREVLSIRLVGSPKPVNESDGEIVERRLQDLLKHHDLSYKEILISEIRQWQLAIIKEQERQSSPGRKLRYLSDMQLSRRVDKIINFMAISISNQYEPKSCKLIF